MAGYEKSDIVVVSSKGQVVIPQSEREKLGIGPETKLLVYGYKDAIIMKKVEVPDLVKEFEELYESIDERIAKYGELSEEKINQIVQKCRKQRV